MSASKPKRVRKPKPAEPAPPVAEAEGRYAVLNANGGDVWFEDFDRVDDPTRHVGTRKEALALRPHPHLTPEVVRILPDGEHEAALAAAREEGALQALAECRVRLEYWLDLWRHRAKAPEYPGDEVASGAKVEAYEQAVLTIDEAAKGAAK